MLREGKHYWVFLLLGIADTITIMNNYVVNTSGELSYLELTTSAYHSPGRGPHIGI